MALHHPSRLETILTRATGSYKMPRQYETLTRESHVEPRDARARVSEIVNLAADMVDHFMEFGYCVVKQAFTLEQAKEVAGDVWVRLGMDPEDSSTWNKVGGVELLRKVCARR